MSSPFSNFLFLPILLSLFFITNQHFVHQCVHEQISAAAQVFSLSDFEDPNLRNLEENDKKGIFDTKKTKPIRIRMETSGLNNLSPSLKSMITEKILPVAINFFNKRIKVMPQQGSIKIPSNLKRCHMADIPPDHHEKGVSDADLVLYVTYLDEPRDTYLAWATPCLHGDETINYRPIAGQINFNSARLKEDIASFEKQVDTTLHEMTHVLAFSPRLFGKFRKRNGERRNFEETIVETKARGVSTNLLVTPKLIEVAKNYYNCPNIKGIELENQGSLGSRGAHFERAIFFDEMMTSSISKDSSFSIFTMALMEDSGWYEVDYSLAEPFAFGKRKGCSFVEKACKDERGLKEYCYDDQAQCTFNNYQKGFCFKKDDFSDSCAFPVSFDMQSKDCRVPQTASKANIYAENFGPNSKCVVSTFTIAGWTVSSDPVRCMEYKCFNNKIFFYIDGKEAAVCEKARDKVNAPKGYQGTLECPDLSDFCEYQHLICPNYCSGNGYCFKGECECKPKTSGVDCSGK